MRDLMEMSELLGVDLAFVKRGVLGFGEVGAVGGIGGDVGEEGLAGFALPTMKGTRWPPSRTSNFWRRKGLRAKGPFDCNSGMGGLPFGISTAKSRERARNLERPNGRLLLRPLRFRAPRSRGSAVS